MVEFLENPLWLWKEKRKFCKMTMLKENSGVILQNFRFLRSVSEAAKAGRSKKQREKR